MVRGASRKLVLDLYLPLSHIASFDSRGHQETVTVITERASLRQAVPNDLPGIIDVLVEPRPS